MYLNEYAEILYMNISTGMSVINYPALRGNSVESRKLYLWPVYNAGGVEKVHAVRGRTSSPVNIQAVSEEYANQIHKMKESGEMLYTSQGRAYNSNIISSPLGSMFTLLA